MQQLLENFPTNPLASPPGREMIHDLRNLFGIVASAERLLERDPNRSQRQALLGAIEGAAIRGGRLTTELLARRLDCRADRTTDIGRRLSDLVPMLIALAGSRIECDLEIAHPSALVRIDGDAFDSTILELIANAVAAHACQIRLRSHKAGSRIWIMVCDDGDGMGSAALSRARAGVDQGLARGAGLSRVHRFARAVHGQLRIRSRPAGGTAIALIVPTLLSVAVGERPAASVSDFLKPKETIDENRQPIAA